MALEDYLGGTSGQAAKKIKGRGKKLKQQECTGRGMDYDQTTGQCKQKTKKK